MGAVRLDAPVAEVERETYALDHRERGDLCALFLAQGIGTRRTTHGAMLPFRPLGSQRTAAETLPHLRRERTLPAVIVDAHHHFLDPAQIDYPFLRFLPAVA